MMRRAWIVPTLALLLLGLFAPASFAADAAGAEKHSPNPMSFSVDLGLWALVVFVLLLFILSKLAWKPMLEGLKKREENILGAIREAEKARGDARKIQAELEAERHRWGEQARDILDEARRDADRAKEEIVAAGRAEVQADRDRLRREIDTATDQALKKIWDQSAQLATLISAKAIRQELSPDVHRRLVDEALAELREARPNQN